MTPAAPHFEGFAPKAKFRRIHRRSFGSEAAKAKKSLKFKPDHKKLLNSPYSNVESCDEEDTSPKRKRLSPVGHRFAATPSTSKKTHCDNHVEFSDEDAQEASHITYGQKYNKLGSERTKGDSFKTEDSLTDKHVNGASVNDLLTKHCYYIVQNDGKPAEMFRTDLVDRLRKGIDAHIDSDDEDIPGSGLARMADRWRTEWSCGTQVPLQPDSPTVNEVRKTIVKYQHLSLSCTHQRKILMKNFLSKPYVEFPREPLRLYECTRLDEQWLALINKKRADMHCQALTMGTFLEIMNAFEIECYKNIHKKLLEPLHSPSSRIGEYDEEAPCDICRACESEPDDEMVFCDGCNLCIHMSCYGLQVLPPGEWLCMKCRYCFGRNPPCILCPTIGGALKLTDKNQWAHVVCALWIHECRFGDIEKREPITCVDEIDEERWTAKCSVCDTRQGACIKCSVSSCKTFFHVTCALRSGLEMRIEQDSDDDKVHMISLCQKHRSAKIFDNGTISDPNQQSGSDEETEGQSCTGMLRHFEQICYQFVDYKKIAERFSIDYLRVSDVFEYWKWRRQTNNGNPLVDNLQDEIKIEEPEQLQLELPEYVEGCYVQQLATKGGRARPKMSATEDFDLRLPPHTTYTPKRMTRTVRTWVRLCNSLHKGQDLLGMVLRQKKEEHNYFRNRGAAAMLIAEHISRPVPLSQRTITYLKESVERLCTEDVLKEGEARADELCNCSDQPTPSETPPLPRTTCISSMQSSPSTSSSSESYRPPESRSPTPVCNKLYNTRATTDRTLLPSSRASTNGLKKPTSFPDNSGKQCQIKREGLRSAETKEENRNGVKLHCPTGRIRSASPNPSNISNQDGSLRHIKEDTTKEGGRFDTTRNISRRFLDSGASHQSPFSAVSQRSFLNESASVEAKSSAENEPQIRKRLRSSTDASNTTLKVFKNFKILKNKSKDITTGQRSITQVGDDVKVEPRTLRSRSSLPPMFRVPRMGGKRAISPLKNVSGFERNHTKRRSDVGLNASARTIYAQ